MQATLLLRHPRRVLTAFFDIFLAVGAARAQLEPIKVGLIDGRDLTAALFVTDRAAATVELCDYGRSYLKGQCEPADQYAGLRKLCHQLLTRQSERLIIQKKAGG